MWCKEHLDSEHNIFVGAVQFMLRVIECDEKSSQIGSFQSGKIEKNTRLAMKIDDVEYSTLSEQLVCQETTWILFMTQRCCLSPTSFVGAIIYMQRIFKYSMAEELFIAHGWRNIFTALVIISEKFWEDNYVHPMHILNMFRAKSKNYKLVYEKNADMLKLQMTILDALQYDVNVGPVEFSDWVHFLDRWDQNNDRAQLIKNILSSVAKGKKINEFKIFIPRPLPGVKDKDLRYRAPKRFESPDTAPSLLEYNPILFQHNVVRKAQSDNPCTKSRDKWSGVLSYRNVAAADVDLRSDDNQVDRRRPLSHQHKSRHLLIEKMCVKR